MVNKFDARVAQVLAQIDWRALPTFKDCNGVEKQYTSVRIGIGRGGMSRARMTGTGIHSHIIYMGAFRIVEKNEVNRTGFWTACGLKGLSFDINGDHAITCTKCAKKA